MRITTHNTYGPWQDRDVSLAWTADEDPRGYLARLIESGRLAEVLAAVADPLEFGNTSLLANERDALDRLRAAVELSNLLTDRISRLSVILRDQYEVGWGVLAQVVEPDGDGESAVLDVYYSYGCVILGVPLADES